MREYFCAYHNMLDGTRKLSDAECGRLFRALLQYSAGADAEQIKLQGREEVLFDVYSQQIDRDIKAYDKKIKSQQENGRKGGRPKKADDSRENPNNPRVFPETQITQEKEKEEEKEEDKEKEKEEIVVEYACAREALPGADTLEAYATGNLQYMSYSHMQELASFKADMPEELIRHAIDEACAAGKRAWAYTRSILNRYLESGFRTIGDVKAAEEKRRSAAGSKQQKSPVNFKQREYSEGENQSAYFDLEKFFAEGGTV